MNFLHIKRNKAILKSQSGQAIVEYMLLIVIIIAVATLAGLKLFKPANSWATFYLFDYTYCMLDQAQLPEMVGGAPTDCENISGSDPSFKAGAGGNGSDGSSGNNAGKGSGNGNNDGNDNSSEDKNSKNVSRSDNNQNGGASRNSRNPRSRSSSGRSISGEGGADSSGSGRSANGAGEGEDSTKEVGSKNSKNSKTNSDDYSSYARGRRIQTKGFSGALMEEKERIQVKDEKGLAVAESGGGNGQNQRKLALNDNKKDVKIAERETEGFNIGDWVRYIVIAGIFGIIIYLIAGQLNGIVKSMEK